MRISTKDRQKLRWLLLKPPRSLTHLLVIQDLLVPKCSSHELFLMNVVIKFTSRNNRPNQKSWAHPTGMLKLGHISDSSSVISDLRHDGPKPLWHRRPTSRRNVGLEDLPRFWLKNTVNFQCRVFRMFLLGCFTCFWILHHHVTAQNLRPDPGSVWS